MRVAQFVTADLPFPYPKGQIFAPLDTSALLAEGLVRRGVDVTWYATEGTKSPARIASFGIKPLRLMDGWEDFPQTKKDHLSVLYSAAFLSHVAKEYEQYDVIHLHTFFLALAFARLMPNKPIVLTLHNPLTSIHVQANLDLHEDVRNLHFVSISDNQRLGRKGLNYQATIYHGLKVADLPWSTQPEDRWIFVGRVVPDKGAHIAVRIAKKAKIKLDIVGPNYLEDATNAKYFHEEIEPFLDGENIRYLGSKTREELSQLYSKAKGYLFPLQWEEPFGLTVIEALAAGTPTVAFKRGSMAEIIEDGKTGFIVDSEAAMVEAIGRIDQIDRGYCRQQAEKRFSSERVIDEYLKLYCRLVSDS